MKLIMILTLEFESMDMHPIQFQQEYITKIFCRLNLMTLWKQRTDDLINCPGQLFLDQNNDFMIVPKLYGLDSNPDKTILS